MLVDVVEMYKRGQRLERGSLKFIQAQRGVLSLTPDRPGRDPRDRNPPLLAGLRGAEGLSWVLPPLDKARVVRINPRGMLIKGRQELQSTRSSRSSEWFDQAWWVRVVPAAPDLRALELEHVQSVHLPY